MVITTGGWQADGTAHRMKELSGVILTMTTIRMVGSCMKGIGIVMAMVTKPTIVDTDTTTI
jgi:hypothetical protein